MLSARRKPSGMRLFRLHNSQLETPNPRTPSPSPNMSPEARLAAKLSELGMTMPPPPTPKGLYKSVIVAGKTAYTSGHLPIDADGKLILGRLGAEMDVEAGKRAAVLVGLNLLASIRQELGSLDRVGRIIKILGAVNCTPDFTQQPAVVNGCSELLAEVFGPDRGVGARSAIGVGSLPLGVPVEIEAVFEIAD
jgi:enamine deaminase RidA (YjgF/YER057c/UK114 family)